MEIRAGDRRSPRITWIGDEGDVPAALDRLELRRGTPVLVLVGGAGGMDEDDIRALDIVLRQAVLPAVADRDATVVDGGTDSGVMRAIGQARSAAGAEFALVGVAAEGTVRMPGHGPPAIEGAAVLEPNHTHVVLVPGRVWGAESPWIAHVADVIAAESPSVTVLVNGGEIAFDDVAGSLEQGRPVVVLAGTGRTADAITAAREASDPREVSDKDSRAARIAGSRLTTIVPVQDVGSVRAAIISALA
jgi:hypothetical protein